MSQEKYVFNPSTLQYEKVELSLKRKLYISLGFVSAVLVTAMILLAVAYSNFSTPKELALEREIAQMEYYYQDLSDQFTTLTDQIDELQRKDADVHRVIFGLEPIDDNVWNGGIGGREAMVRLRNNASANALLSESLDKVDKLNRKIDLQSSSMEGILETAKSHEDRLAAVPSIKPIQEDKLKRKVRHLSGYGMRIHPVHKVKKMHQGIDFTAPRGTPIQATGNGRVIKAVKSRTGYGHHIIIDHGYGYKTLYGHLSNIMVKKGDIVGKGQKIGTVGSSGLSTAPHCHYEVRINDRPVDPINYILDGLTPAEYQQLVAKASEENQSFD